MSAFQQPEPRRRGGFVRMAGIGCLSLIGVVVAIVVIAAVVSTGGDDTTTTSAEEPEQTQQAAEPEAASVGDQVRDGKFEFTVTDVKTGVTSIGSDFLEEKPQGQFVLVKVTVENIGDEAQYLSASDQFLYDTADRKHSASEDAWLAMEDNPLLEQVNPGNKVTGTIVFDIPKNAKPKRLELHDSMFSGGVEVEVAATASE